MTVVMNSRYVLQLSLFASFLVGDSSQSSPFIDVSVKFCVEGDSEPNGNEPIPARVVLNRLENSRTNPKVLKLATRTRIDRVTRAAGEKVTSLLPRKDDMKRAETSRKGTVTADVNAGAIVALRLTSKRYAFIPTTEERAKAR